MVERVSGCVVEDCRLPVLKAASYSSGRACKAAGVVDSFVAKAVWTFFTTTLAAQ